jgi:hypothetical protein
MERKLDATTIAIVLDEEFSSQLFPLASRVPVWVIDSPSNRPAIESIWAARRLQGVPSELAVFRQIPGLTPASHLLAVLRTVRDQERAEDEPPCEIAEVFGLALTVEVEGELRALVTGRFTATPDGFRVVTGFRAMD